GGADKVTVRLHDGREFTGQVKRDFRSDLAVVKIAATSPLPVARLGDSDKVKVGHWAIAIGSPYRYEGSLSVGVISSLYRTQRIGDFGSFGRVRFYPNLLQTDAAINPGNSGGPLCNLDGELIGLNTAIHAGGQGIGFAIPVDRVRTVLRDLSDPEMLRDSWLGWKLDETKDGVVVTSVGEGSPVAQAGIQTGDVVAKVGAARATSVFEVHKQFFSQEGAVSLTVEGKDGAEKTVSITPAASPSRVAIEKRLGIQGRSLTPPIAWRKGFEVETGILVMGVTAGGPAQRIGVEAGDVVTKFARKVVDGRLGQQ